MTVYFVMLLASGYIRKIGRISSIFLGIIYLGRLNNVSGWVSRKNCKLKIVMFTDKKKKKKFRSKKDRTQRERVCVFG